MYIIKVFLRNLEEYGALSDGVRELVRILDTDKDDDRRSNLTGLLPHNGFSGPDGGVLLPRLPGHSAREPAVAASVGGTGRPCGMGQSTTDQNGTSLRGDDRSTRTTGEPPPGTGR